MNEDENFDSVWDRMSDASPAPADQAAGTPAHAHGHEHAQEHAHEHDHEHAHGDQPDPGPPIRVVMVVVADTVPVAPWAQGWRVGATEPADGHVTMLFEHDVHDSPVAQLAAVTGLLGTIKAAHLEVIWWTIQTRAPFPGEVPEEPTANLEQQLSDFLLSQDDTHEDSD